MPISWKPADPEPRRWIYGIRQRPAIVDRQNSYFRPLTSLRGQSEDDMLAVVRSEKELY